MELTSRILTQRDNPAQFGRFNNGRDAAVSRIVVCRWFDSRFGSKL